MSVGEEFHPRMKTPKPKNLEDVVDRPGEEVVRGGDGILGGEGRYQQYDYIETRCGVLIDTMIRVFVLYLLCKVPQ